MQIGDSFFIEELATVITAGAFKLLVSAEKSQAAEKYCHLVKTICTAVSEERRAERGHKFIWT